MMKTGIDCNGRIWSEKIKISPKSYNFKGQRFGKLLPLFRVDCNKSGVWWLC